MGDHTVDGGSPTASVGHPEVDRDLLLEWVFSEALNLEKILREIHHGVRRLDFSEWSKLRSKEG